MLFHVLTAMAILMTSGGHFSSAEEGSTTSQNSGSTSHQQSNNQQSTTKAPDSEAHGSYDSTSVFSTDEDDGSPIGHNFREGEYSYNYYTQSSKLVGTGHVSDNGHVKIYDNSETLNYKPGKNIGNSVKNHGSSFKNDYSQSNVRDSIQNHGSSYKNDFSNDNSAEIHDSSYKTDYSDDNTAQIHNSHVDGTHGTDGEYSYGGSIGHNTPEGTGGTSFVYVSQSGHQNTDESYYPAAESEEHVLGETSGNIEGENTEEPEIKGHTIQGYNTNLDLTSSNVQEGTYVVTDHGETPEKSLGDVKQILGNTGGSVSYIFVSQGVSENQDIVHHNTGVKSGGEPTITIEDETARSGTKQNQFGAASFNQGSQSISRVHTPPVADFGLTVDSEGQNMGQIFGNPQTSGGLGLQSGVRDGNQGHFYGGHINHGKTGVKPGALTDKHLFGGIETIKDHHDSEEGGNFGLQMPGSIEMEGHPDAGHSYGGNQVIHHNSGDAESSFGLSQQHGYNLPDKHLFENQGNTEENSGFHGNSGSSFGGQENGGFHENNGPSFGNENSGFEEYNNGNNQFKSSFGGSNQQKTPSFGNQNTGFGDFKGNSQFKPSNGPYGGKFQQSNNFQGIKANPLQPLNFNTGAAYGQQYGSNLNQFKGSQNLGHQNRPNKPNNFGHENRPNFGQENRPNFGQGGIQNKPNNFGQNLNSNKPGLFGENGHNFGQNQPNYGQNRPNNYGQNIPKPNFGNGGPDLGLHVEGEVGGTGNIFGNHNNGVNFANSFGSYGQKLKPNNNVAPNLFNQNNPFGQNNNNNGRGPLAQKNKPFNKIKHQNKEVSIRHQTKVQGISNALLFGGHARSTQRSHDLKPNGHMWAGHMMNENFRFGVQKNAEGHYVGLPQTKYVNNFSTQSFTNNFQKPGLGGQYDSRSKYAEGPEMNDNSGKSYDVKEPNNDNMKFVNVNFAKHVTYPSGQKGQLSFPRTTYNKMAKKIGEMSTYAPGSGYKTIKLPVYTKKIRQVES